MIRATVTLATIFVGAAFGQNSFSVNSSGDFAGTVHFPAPMPFMAPPAVAGAPYSADEITERVQTLADGTHITQKPEPVKTFRDSLGRVRTERSALPAMAFARVRATPPTIVEITDPVAQVKYVLDPIGRVAHRQQLPAAPQPVRGRVLRDSVPMMAAGSGGGAGGSGPVTAVLGAGLAGHAAATVRPQMSTETLGTREIEGVTAEGTRRTTTWPIDSQGNDRPISGVIETWFSPDLKIEILSTNNDPRFGENTHKVVNISRSEPSASLFEVPPDYSVVDEKADFSINWGNQ